MSKKRKKHSQKKKYNQRKQQSVRKIEKKNPLDFQPVKTFFIELKEKMNLENIQAYFSRNKKGVLFTVAMTAIVAVGYFTIVYQPESPAVVSVDLNQEQTSFMEDVEGEIGNIQGESNTVTASLDEPVEVVVEEPVESEEPEEVVIEEEVAVQPSIDVITSADVTGKKISLEVVEEKPVHDAVQQSMMLGIDMYAILVDNEEVAYFETKAAADALLEELQSKYLAEGAVEERIIFRESVEIKKVKRNVLTVMVLKQLKKLWSSLLKVPTNREFIPLKKVKTFG